MNEQTLITSVRVQRGPAHDKVHVWSEHAKAGVLTVSAGLGSFVAQRLLGDDVPTITSMTADGVEIRMVDA